VPAVQRDADADRIVVWAPDLSLDALGPLCLALEEMSFSVTIIAREGGRFDLPVVGVEQAQVLARARLIIDASTDAPDAAHALARIGAPLMVPAWFAAEPTLAGVVPYLPENMVVIGAAIRHALTLPPARSTRVEVTVADPGPPEGLPGEGMAKVSIIVPTCNRPAFLRRALASIEQQRWPRVEALVVNDGEEDVAPVVGGFSRARLIENPRVGSGPSAARNLGLAAADGEFVGFLDDDDILFPDHCARMITALERSGAEFAQSDIIACFARWDENGRCRIEAIEMFPTPQELRQMQYTCIFVLPSLMFRRRLLERERFDEDLIVCEDYDLWTRLMKRATPCYQPVPTAAFISWANGANNSNMRAHLFREAYATVYARHPTDDPMVAAQRAKELNRLEERGGGRPPVPMLGRYLVDADLAWLERLERA
jgi:hypothetical protein